MAKLLSMTLVLFICHILPFYELKDVFSPLACHTAKRKKEEKEKNDKMNKKKATEINSGSEIKTVDSVGAYGLNKSVQKQ